MRRTISFNGLTEREIETRDALEAIIECIDRKLPRQPRRDKWLKSLLKGIGGAADDQKLKAEVLAKLRAGPIYWHQLAGYEQMDISQIKERLKVIILRINQSEI